MSGALSHIRVLDLSRVLAGPWAGLLLADLGAEVIKVERPGAGDDTRRWGPPYLKDEEGRDTSEAAYYLAANRGKKSVTLDISRPEGQEIVRRLAARSDILLENYMVGTLQRYGLGYEELKAVNPRLIYCSITGFGQTGPYSHRAGYDFIVQGMSGLMSVTGEREGVPGGGPQKVGIPVADLFTGLYSTTAVLAALASRDVTGVGQHVDMALLDVLVATMGTAYMNYLTSGNVLKSYGNAAANIVPYQAFPCKDGRIVLAIGNDGQFAKFCEIAGNEELARDERFATNDLRVRNRTLLVPILEELLGRRCMQEWVDALDTAGVPCGPINDIAQVFENPQVQHRGMLLEMPHPLSGKVPQVASPFRLSATPVEYRAAPPTLGQHTRDILQGVLGMDEEELAGLADKGVI
jgi:crotonobetainyl-CoA:carnitine CoA-transferase CaiB-like acyl-CoA transferase